MNRQGSRGRDEGGLGLYEEMREKLLPDLPHPPYPPHLPHLF